MLALLLAATAPAAADAFAGAGLCHRNRGALAPRHAADDGRSSDGGAAKSMFGTVFQNLQLPWDDPLPKPPPPPLRSRMAELLGGEKPPRRKEPRAPRYPSALHEQLHRPPVAKGDTSEVDTSEGDTSDAAINGDKADIEEYVRSAEEAARPMRANGDSSGSRSSAAKEKRAAEAEGPSDAPSRRAAKTTAPRKPKLGILLIDHGSKRKASNDHLASVAASYQSSFDGLTTAQNENGCGAKVAVRAAHMEIAEPSILTMLRQMIVADEATRIVCVPYFLSPGKHATIDVPNLIDDAIARLDQEGLLDYTRWNREGKAEGTEGRIEIASSAALGTNVDRMLGVVDGLVQTALSDEEAGDIFELGARGDAGINGDSGSTADESNRVKEETEKELRKYANRAALLENLLSGKAKQVTTMTNRAALMEDALGRLTDKRKREREEGAKEWEEEKRWLDATVANATTALEAAREEKEALETQITSLELQMAEAERGYNATLAEAEAKLASMKRELEHLLDKRESKQLLNAEQSKSAEEEARREAAGRERKIDELQLQLADLLDAYAELEQLQNETEASAVRYRGQLQELEAGYNQSIEAEREEKEGYRSKWMDVQQQLEADGNRTQEAMLEKSTEEYEALAEEERGRAEGWRLQCEALTEELASVRNATLSTNGTANTATRAEEEWTNLQAQLDDVATANASATERVVDLERQLQIQKEEHEMLIKQREEQQEQLQKYLRAQLSTYYDTIQDQTSQIEDFQTQIDEMEQRHNDSMLIATNSVEASLRREEELLTSVEELEAELVGVKAERDHRGIRLEELQLRLDSLEGTVAAAKSSEEESSSSRETLERDNDDLRGEVERLRCEVQSATEEKERMAAEKARIAEEVGRLPFLPRRVRDAVAGDATEGEKPRGQKRRWLRRAILRPWTLFRREGADR